MRYEEDREKNREKEREEPPSGREVRTTAITKYSNIVSGFRMQYLDILAIPGPNIVDVRIA